MARITKQQLIKENEALKTEIASLKQAITHLEAQVNFYQGIEKQVGIVANGCLSWFGGFVPKDVQNP